MLDDLGGDSQVVVVEGLVARSSDGVNFKLIFSGGLENSGVQNWSLLLKVGSDEEQHISVLHSNDSRIHQVGGSEIRGNLQSVLGKFEKKIKKIRGVRDDSSSRFLRDF